MFLSSLLALLALASHAVALHMYLGSNEEPTCFFLDLSRDTLLAETHSAWELEADTGKWVRDDTLAIDVTIDEMFDNGHRVYHHKLAPFDSFNFVAQDGGEHKVCYRALVHGWFAKNTIKLEVDYVVGSDSLVDSQNEKKVGTLADRIADLNRKLVYIRREQALMREREESFRDQSEATNSRVAYMTVFQLIVLSATCAWQISHLRGFFTKQKLV